MANGDLKSYLRRCESQVSGNGFKIGADHMLKLAIDVTNGFNYLQEMQYVHRDIAARNVLLSSSFSAKIGDFGLLALFSFCNTLMLV
jgi:serine/threonine protein kinase